MPLAVKFWPELTFSVPPPLCTVKARSLEKPVVTASVPPLSVTPPPVPRLLSALTLSVPR